MKEKKVTKRLFGILPLLCVISACSDVVPFPEPNVKGELESNLPFAYFVVEGTLTDTVAKTAVPLISVQLHNQPSVLTDENGHFITFTSAFPIGQEFSLVINGPGKLHQNAYPVESTFVHFLLPTFQLSREDITALGPEFLDAVT